MKYAIVDVAGDMPAADLEAYATAQQIQLRRDYASHYDGDGIEDVVRVATKAAPLESGECAINFYAVAPASAGEGAIGEHGIDTCNVYRDIAAQASVSVTSCASHEVMENRRDPGLHDCIELDDGTIIDVEICDRVEADTYAISVNVDDIDHSVEMSNFNTPACFEPRKAPGEIYDHMRLSTRPNEVRPGGYAQQLVPGRGWVQQGAMRAYRAELAKRGLSRGAKRDARRTPRDTDGLFVVCGEDSLGNRVPIAVAETLDAARVEMARLMTHAKEIVTLTIRLVRFA